MKICIISPTFPYANCGVGDYTAGYVRSLFKYNVGIALITSDNEKIRKFSEHNSREAGKLSIYPIVKRWGFGSLGTIFGKIKDINPDIIHIQYHWWNGNDGAVLKGLMMVCLPFILKMHRVKARIFVTLHSRLHGPYLFPKAGFLRQWALAPMLLSSDMIVVTNKYDSKKVSRVPFLRKKLAYIAGGTGHFLEADDLMQEATGVKAGLKSSDNEVILSNFGFMIPHKGLEEILSAMRLLMDKGYCLRLLAIGGFDIENNFAASYLEKIKNMAEELKLTPYIQWMGYCDPKKASVLLLASDICVMPFPDGASEWRSSFLDVLSHGLAVVTTKTERTPEELNNRINCILIPPRDPRRLASAIEELIKSPQLRDSLGKAAAELYRKEYDWPVIAGKAMRSYSMALDDPGSAN